MNANKGGRNILSEDGGIKNKLQFDPQKFKGKKNLTQKDNDSLYSKDVSMPDLPMFKG